MKRYILRRLLQLVPTVLGVIVLTFILFNLVGGSPGRMALGEKASPEQVEAFDEVHGYNKPLLFGTRIRTPALGDQSFARSAGAWAPVSNATFTAASGAEPGRLACSGEVKPPLAFALRAGVAYEWTIRWRTAGGAWRTTREPQFPPRGAGSTFEMASVRVRRVVANPFDSQLWNYLRKLAVLDLGTSNSANLPVARLLRDGLRPTMMLTTPILLAEFLTSVCVGLLCAYYRGRLADRLLVVATVALMSLNYMVWIVGGQYLLAFRLGWFPVWGFESWTYLVLPVLIGFISGLGGDVRLYRAVMIDEIYKDYVRTAYAKGLSTRLVLFKHVLRNAMVPIITNVVLAIPFLYTGSLLLESYFGIPGVGYLSINAINSSDPDVIRAVVVIGSILYVVVGLLGDLLAALVDPRIKLS